MKPLRERVLELEERSAWQERLLDELSGVLHRQQLELDALLKETKRLREQVAALLGAADGPAPNERPPHY